MIFSAGTEQLAVVAYVPEERQGALSCEAIGRTSLSRHPRAANGRGERA